MSATTTSAKEKVMDTVKGIFTSVVVDMGMEEIRDRAKKKIEGFAQKARIEHRVEMFYAVLVQMAEKIPDGHEKRKAILERWAMRQLGLPREYGPGRPNDGVPYEPLAEYHMIEVYLDNKRFLQEKNLEEDYFKWLDEMASMTDEEHDLVLEAYTDDKWNRLFLELAQFLRPVNDALAQIPGSASPDIFRGGFNQWWVQAIAFAIFAVLVIVALS